VVTHEFDSEDSLESQFVLQQLCAMLPVLDQSDEAGRYFLRYILLQDRKTLKM